MREAINNWFGRAFEVPPGPVEVENGDKVSKGVFASFVLLQACAL